ncbi:MAG: flagellar biosynthetic protein FliQ [Dehalococcoidia bacterium]|nr:MAG: flagellar biosynthetic protein FliQ [Dehalococcoidia bacterium]
MNDATVIGLGQDALMTALMVSGPILAVSLGVGLIVSVFQAMTQINEATLSFVPKVLGVFAVSAVLGPWMIGTMVNYTTQLFVALPDLAR